MWFPTHRKVHVALDAIIAGLRQSDERLKSWERQPRLLPNSQLAHIVATLREVVDSQLSTALEVSVALSYDQITPKQVASNIKPAEKLAKQISRKLDELDAGAAHGRAVFEERFGISNAQNR